MASRRVQINQTVFSKRFGKGPFISAGVEKGWLPKIGCRRVRSDIKYHKCEIGQRLSPLFLGDGSGDVRNVADKFYKRKHWERLGKG